MMVKNINTSLLLTEEDKKRIEAEERYRRELQETKFCFRCGEKIDALAEICPHCGVRQSSVRKHDGKNRITAVLFAFFLGWIGFHKFYLNKPIQGLLYLFFFWTGIPAIFSLVEGIRYLSYSDDAFEEEFSR